MHGTTPESHKELEVKLELVPAGLPALKKIPHLRTRTTARRATEISVYFDTDNQKLRKKRTNAACAAGRQPLFSDHQSKWQFGAY